MEKAINLDASIKNTIYMKNIIFEILLHVVVKIENIQQVLFIIQQLHVMKLYKKQKQFQQILMKKNITCKTQNLYVLLDFLLIIIGLIAVSIYRYLLKR